MTARTVVMVDSSPLGVRVVDVFDNGACIPQRGSGPSKKVVMVLSGDVVVVNPFVPMTVTVWELSVPVFTRRWSPVGKSSTRYFETRFIAEALLTSYPLVNSVRSK